MKVSEITVGQKKVDVTGTITAIGEKRVVNLKAGGTSTVCDATLSDESGAIKVPLWGEHQFKVGDKVQISNGFTTSYKGALQLSIGKFGKIARV